MHHRGDNQHVTCKASTVWLCATFQCTTAEQVVTQGQCISSASPAQALGDTCIAIVAVLLGSGGIHVTGLRICLEAYCKSEECRP